tara:strand:+ start:43 stop:198 length:156 start_codon:yes stop_codon:yes gene_type:complete
MGVWDLVSNVIPHSPQRKSKESFQPNFPNLNPIMGGYESINKAHTHCDAIF